MHIIKYILILLFSTLGVCAGYGQSVLHTDTVVLKNDVLRLIYTIDEDTICYGSVKQGMNHGIWKGLYRDGTLRYTSSYKNGQIHGESNYYHRNGTLKAVTHHNEGLRSKTWTSFYENGEVMSQISWDSSGMPLKVEVSSESGVRLLSKEFKYDEYECSVRVKRRYRNGSPLENYTTYISISRLSHLLTYQGINYILDLTPNFGLPFHKDEKLSGYYYRYFNSGKLWMQFEFDEGRLIEVISQNSPTGSSISEPFLKGSGKLIHFHHYGDTAAVFNYEAGLPDGNLKYFYTGNNTYMKGSALNGIPTSFWTKYSYSGKVNYTLAFSEDSIQWNLYGPKSNKYRSYPIINGYLDGMGKEYDYYDQVAAEYAFTNGFLNGSFSRWLNGNVTRFGNYAMGEQVGDWITPGLFNPVSHTTRFREKDVIIKKELLPRFSFDLNPNIEMPRLKLPREFSISPYSNELELYSEDQFKTVLLELPDSDEIIGTSFMKLTIDENGNLNQLETIKSPSESMKSYAESFIISDALFTTNFVLGIPDLAINYVIVEHFRQ